MSILTFTLLILSHIPQRDQLYGAKLPLRLNHNNNYKVLFK